MPSTNGIFSLDGEDFEVENNIWLVGDDDEVLVVDAAHDAAPIVEAVGGRDVARHRPARTATTTTSTRRSRSRDAVDAPILLHPADRMLWDVVYPNDAPDGDARRRRRAARRRRRAAACCTRPGTVPVGCACSTLGRSRVRSATRCSRAARARPAAPSRASATSSSRSATRLLTLPPETVVHTGHGDATTIGDEAPHLDEWLARGH